MYCVVHRYVYMFEVHVYVECACMWMYVFSILGLDIQRISRFRFVAKLTRQATLLAAGWFGVQATMAGSWATHHTIPSLSVFFILVLAEWP